ncbi:MAG: apolipoprotein N-acyltransferase [Spirochaetota bacterium]
MRPDLRGHPGQVTGGLLLVLSAAGLYFSFGGPFALSDPGLGDSLFFLLIGLHFLWGAVLVFRRDVLELHRAKWFFRMPEVLLSYSVVLFLFAYFFALNANMDYVQRFIETGGDLRLAVDATTERRLVFFRYFPFVLADVAVYLYFRLRYYRVAAGVERRSRAEGRLAHALGSGPETGPESAPETGGNPHGPSGRRPDAVGDFVRVWGLLLVFVAVFVTVASYPSFMTIDGVAILGWVSLFPLILVLRAQSYGRGVFYGVVYGVLATLVVNYWLATFSLVSLQSAVVIFFFFYLAFMVVGLFLYHAASRLHFLLLALAWTAFELGRSSGFLGYPWALVGHAQYDVLPLVQLSALTGVWGVSFVVVLVNSALAHALPMGARRTRIAPLVAAASVVVVVFVGGWISLTQAEPVGTEAGRARGEDSVEATDGEAAGAGAENLVRVALIQQNSDPRKHDYNRTLDSLQTLTDSALEENPDIVVWSETAFVPNIRRWSREDPQRYSLARIVERFLEYQEETGTHLVTGNDDYERVLDDGEEVERLNYNATVFFGPEGKRLETYHKIRLVPFTEHFPYEETLPQVYELLQEFDVNFWEPGDERTVFEHPKFDFSTPICFEDMFPVEVREFVENGAEVIVNMTNDYWSLTPVQAKQHFIGSLFRTAENRRPMVRATASGLTAHVDKWGRVLDTAPYYEEAYLVSDVRVPEDDSMTIYTRLGDWFPVAAGVVAIAIALASIPSRIRRHSAGPSRS